MYQPAYRFSLVYHFDMMMLLFSLGVKQELCHRILMGFYSSPFFATAAACVYTFKLRELIWLICGSIMPFYTHVQCYIW